MKKKALEEKLAARKAKLSSVVGSDKADATFEAIKGLEDVLMLFLLQWQHHLKKATTELFQETGLSGEPAPAIEMTTEEKILRQNIKTNKGKSCLLQLITATTQI